MAQVAQGLQSPCCGTFSTVSGSYGDEQLTGACQRCSKPITAPNPEYDASKVVKYFHANVVGPDGRVGVIEASGINLEVNVSGVTTAPDAPAVAAPALQQPAEQPERIAPEQEQPESQQYYGE